MFLENGLKNNNNLNKQPNLLSSLIKVEKIEVHENIDLIVLSPIKSDETERNFLSDLYHWEELLLHLSRHSTIINSGQLNDIEIIFKRLFETIPPSHKKNLKSIWIDRVLPVLKFLANSSNDKYAKRQEFNSKYAAISVLTSSFINQIPRLVALDITRYFFLFMFKNDRVTDA